MAKRKKTGGRQQGTPNRLTKDLRNSLKNILADEFEKLPETLNRLDPKDRLEIVVKILPYILPRIEIVEMMEGEPFQIPEW